MRFRRGRDRSTYDIRNRHARKPWHLWGRGQYEMECKITSSTHQMQLKLVHWAPCIGSEESQTWRTMVGPSILGRLPLGALKDDHRVVRPIQRLEDDGMSIPYNVKRKKGEQTAEVSTCLWLSEKYRYMIELLWWQSKRHLVIERGWTRPA